MADLLLEARRLPDEDIILGSQLVDVVTGGMYNDPLMVLREYVQNAVDSLDLAYERGTIAPGDGRVDVRVDGMNRIIAVSDNGVGVQRDRIWMTLCGLGCSMKERLEQRGFRGIGRLGGLGYCDRLVFETRAGGEESVSVVTWDGLRLQGLNGSMARLRAEDAVRHCVSVGSRAVKEGEPPQFFCATMINVHRFHRDDLMNPKAVAAFLSRVAPVDFDEARFAFGPEVRRYISQVPGYRSYRIHMNGEPVVRPHMGAIVVDGKVADRIERVELFEVHDVEGAVVGRGWYAITNFLSALTSQVPMRGIRVRQGNIEVGNEYSLADLYTERRFATWHIGEVHLDYTVKANARRDGFEHSPSYEAFLEQMSFLCRQLSAVCRDSSKRRGKEKAAETAVARLEGLVRLQIIIDREELQKAADQAEFRLKQLAALRSPFKNLELLQQRLEAAKKEVNGGVNRKPEFSDLLDGRKFSNARNVLRDIARSIVATYDGNMGKERLLSIIFGPYMKKGALEEFLGRGSGEQI